MHIDHTTPQAFRPGDLTIDPDRFKEGKPERPIPAPSTCSQKEAVRYKQFWDGPYPFTPPPPYTVDGTL